MSMPASQCDAPECTVELVALIRGVGLCERHFQILNACATQQGVNPTSLARQVVMALLRSPLAQELAHTAVVPAQRRYVAPGFYWLAEGDGWTIVQVAGATLRRIGEEREYALEEVESQRLLPVQLPAGLPARLVRHTFNK